VWPAQSRLGSGDEPVVLVAGGTGISTILALAVAARGRTTSDAAQQSPRAIRTSACRVRGRSGQDEAGSPDAGSGVGGRPGDHETGAHGIRPLAGRCSAAYEAELRLGGGLLRHGEPVGIRRLARDRPRDSAGALTGLRCRDAAREGIAVDDPQRRAGRAETGEQPEGRGGGVGSGSRTSSPAPSPRIRIALEVDDAQGQTRRLAEAGAELVAAPVVTPWQSLNSRASRLRPG
jgi:hypothetical protein